MEKSNKKINKTTSWFFNLLQNWQKNLVRAMGMKMRKETEMTKCREKEMSLPALQKCSQCPEKKKMNANKQS